MSDPTSEKAVSDLVLLSRCRAAEALGLDLSPSEVMTLAALAAERDRLRAALIWCSGSADFNEGGIAADGWQKLCAPLLKGSSHE